MILQLTIGTKLLIFQLHIYVKITSVLLQLLKLIKSDFAANLEDYMFFNKRETRVCTRVFTENTVMVSSFHFTHYLVSMFYFHTFKFKDPNFS